MRFPTTLVMLCIALFSMRSLSAQTGAVFSPFIVSYGLGVSQQKDFASGVGLTSSAHLSFLEIFKKGMEVETGFKVRDILGAHCNLGVRSYPDSQMVNGGVTSSTSKIWYDVGFDYIGLQLMYGFKEELWLSVKGQLYAGWNNTSYYEIFPYAFSTSTVTVGAQVGPFSAEVGRGWEAFQHNGPNYFTVASAYRFREKNTTYDMFGFRLVNHTEYIGSVMISPTEYVEGKSKSFTFILFYAHCI